jgi:hypothetical protein
MTVAASMIMEQMSGLGGIARITTNCTKYYNGMRGILYYCVR